MILDDWQKEALEHKGDLLLCTGRRVGKTQIMAIKAAERMISQKGCRIVIASLTEDQAKLIIIMILEYLEHHYKSEICKGSKKPTQNKIELKNHSQALARPVGTTGDALRGFRGDVLILDEVSRFSRLIMIAATPILLTTGGEIWMCSTPFGKQGYFWDQFNEAYIKQNPESRFKVIYKSTEEVIKNRPISEGWTEKQREQAIRHLEKERRDMSELEYGQEYMGLFLEDLMQFFPDELIDKCAKLQRFQPPGGKIFIGVDLARLGGDELTWEMIHDDGHLPLKHVESIVKTNMLTTESEQFTLDIAKIWKAKKVGLDVGAGTLGVSIFDHLLQSDIRHKIVALNNRAISLNSDGKSERQRIQKEDFYYNLKAMMERGEVLLLDDPEVRLSLKSVQQEFITTKTGKTAVRIFGKYTHIAEGLTRAVWIAVKEKSLNLWATFSGDNEFRI